MTSMKEIRMRSTTLGIALLLALAILLAGCGGGSSGDGGDSGGGSDAQQDEQDGGAEGESGEETGGGKKIALGLVASVKADAGRFAIEPSAEEQGVEPVTFKLAEGGTITLDGKEVELSAMEEGQQVQVEYVVLKDLNRAQVVELFGGEATAE
jgi:hypothetical protein